MFDSQKSGGAGHTAVATVFAFALVTVAALLAFAIVFIPEIYIFLHPGYFGLSLAFAGSAICLVAPGSGRSDPLGSA